LYTKTYEPPLEIVNRGVMPITVVISIASVSIFVPHKHHWCSLVHNHTLKRTPDILTSQVVMDKLRMLIIIHWEKDKEEEIKRHKNLAEKHREYVRCIET